MGLVGRQAELAQVTDFVAAAECGPQLLVLDGEAGIGKTTLYEAALADARGRGFAVFSCRPVDAETAFSFAALADLLAPLLPEGLSTVATASAPGAVRGAVFGGCPVGPRRKSARSQLRRTGSSRSVAEALLIAIDDVQWLDLPSASILAFVLRRLATRPVAILVARRSTDTRGGPAWA